MMTVSVVFSRLRELNADVSGQESSLSVLAKDRCVKARLYGIQRLAIQAIELEKSTPSLLSTVDDFSIMAEDVRWGDVAA